MTDREKIIKVIDKWANRAVITKINVASVYDQNNATELTNALIAANIGDVTEWKERAEKHRVQVLPDGTIKQLYSGEEVEQIVKERDEYKHRAARAEREAIILSKWLANKTRKDYPYQAWLDAARKQAEREIEEGKKE